MQEAWRICASRPPTVWQNRMVTGKDNTAFGSMISTGSAFVLKATADTSIRAGRFFGVSDRYFPDMQNDIEIRELIEKLEGEIDTMKPYADATV